MSDHPVFSMPFGKVYPMYVAKAEKKGRLKSEVDACIFWLTGYDEAAVDTIVAEGKDIRAFFEEAPAFNPNASLIKGVVCGIRVEEVEHPLMRKIRYLDKLIDELAKGKALENVLRS